MNYLGRLTVWIFFTNGHILRANSEVAIFPNNLTMLEGSNDTVRCTYNGDSTVQGADFTLNYSRTATIFLPNCENYGPELTNYRTECENNRTFTLTMINVSRHDHGKPVRCTIFLNNAPPETSANAVLVYVHVPVKGVSITSPTIEDRVLSVCENVNISLQCHTSAARPAANISWVYQSKFPNDGITDVTIRSNTSAIVEVNNLFITTSILYITANRSLNGWHIFCLSSNYPDIVVNSSRIDFDILYPPDQSPTILNVKVTSGGTYRIIEGRQGVLTCSVPISNPKATLTWIGLEHSQNLAKSLDFVSNNLEWVASRRDKVMSTCIAKHGCNNFTKSISVKIGVLYPPTVKPMKNVSILEGSLLNITCDITLGIPEAVTMNWTRQTDILITNSRLLMIQKISRDSASLYICNVANIMKPTIGIEERGESSSSVYIDVLYPPTVDTIKNQTITEGSDFNLSCPVNPGNPNITNITWISIDKRVHRATQFLSFKNISRSHAAVYTCSAFNIMSPTNNIKVEGYDSERFHLVVEYRATIKHFFINGYNSASYVTLNENDNVMFYCNVDSLPTSITDIKFQNGSKLKSTNSTNNVSYELGPATCMDAGVYECSGKNRHNNIQDDAKRKLALFVNCSPRAHPKIKVKSKITTALNVPLILSFTAVAYPLPTTVNWQKFNGFNWTLIVAYDDTSIRKSNLIFNLTIPNVQETDIGHYKLAIMNDIGKFGQTFDIIPADLPKPPTNFQVLTEKVLTSSVTVEWFPSFNGGQSQLFVLNISESDKEIWTNERVEDKGNIYMNYTLAGLLSGTLYKCNIYAENKIGRSNVSETLVFKTKDQDVYVDGQGGNTLGIVVGVASGFICALVAVVLVVWFLRKRLHCRRQKESTDDVYQNDLVLKQDNSCNTNEYEQIRMRKQMTLRNQTGKNSSDTDDRNDTDIHYESLDKSKRDTNEYSQLSLNTAQFGIIKNRNDRHAVCDEFDTRTQVHEPIYTNLKL